MDKKSWVYKIADGVYWVGALHWDRKLFDELIPLPEGTSYNSYVIFGSEKTTLIDAVDFSKQRVLVENLKNLGVKRLDYLVSNHAEQDHSGEIPKILELYPDCKVVTNPKCKDFLKELLLIPDERFITVNDRETISLGNRTLEFIIAPWVHWPETMLTYLREDKILFPCDLFGSHLATTKIIAEDGADLYTGAKRYYAEIMAPFRNLVKQHIAKVEQLGVKMIAPSHGPIYKNPAFIINAYKQWVSDDVKNEVVLPYVSMHGSTEKMVNYLVEALMGRGIVVKPFNLTVTDVGELAMSLVDAATLVIAAPAMLVGPHPYAVYATYLANALRPKLKFFGIIGSYGWGSKLVETIEGILTSVKAEKLPYVIAKGHPKDDDFKSLDKLADAILEKHRSLGIV